MQGAVARNAPNLHKGTLNIRRICSLEVAEEIAGVVDVGSSKALYGITWKNRQSVSGAWTSKIKVGSSVASSTWQLHRDCTMMVRVTGKGWAWEVGASVVKAWPMKWI